MAMAPPKSRKGRKRKFKGDFQNECLLQKKEAKSFLCDSDLVIKKAGISIRAQYSELLEIGLRERCLVILEGPLGCGKSTLVKDVARRLSLSVVMYQIGEEIDAKSLFGSFNCLEIPGQFVWKPSDFTKFMLISFIGFLFPALRQPGIIVMKDLDTGNPDLISIIIDLCEKRSASLLDGSVVEMHHSSYIVGTARSIENKASQSNSDVLLSSNPFRISLPPFSTEELCQIISAEFGRVAPFVRKLVSLFNDVRKHCETIAKPSRRILTTIDLLRACKRLNRLEDVFDNATILIDLIDTWAMHCTMEEDLVKIAAILANHVSVNFQQVDHYLHLRIPDLSVSQTEIVCGRGRCQRAKGVSNSLPVVGITKDVCQLMERVILCIQMNEPVLLVGDSGVGKTAIIQTIASYASVGFHVVNLSQHSDSTDLIGGFKPRSIMGTLQPLRCSYDTLFRDTCDVEKNKKFLNHLDTCISTGNYVVYLTLVARSALAIASKSEAQIAKKWAEISVRASHIKESLKRSRLSFQYIPGVVAKAAEKGEWILIDEINLAFPECLDTIIHVLDNANRNPNFRLFACMNPASDTGKRNLPVGVRARFTELFVRETTDLAQLGVIARVHLPSIGSQRLDSVLQLYEKLRLRYPGKYSLRTLCRALSFASDNLFGGELRNLHEAFSMSFVTNADMSERTVIEKIIDDAIGILPSNPVPPPTVPSPSGRGYIQVEGYWIEAGTEEPFEDHSYVRTESVKKNLALLARVVCSGRYPVLLEGETSAGKTAMVTYLGQITGNKVIRINNHEHTDLQEYIGSYVPDADGRLTFVEGALLKAVRAGHWVILDELNLAPSDVIEALNRLLDDNRELFVTELNVTVKAHSSFRLFATQNPVSTYAGRKRLSRALLNRFIVLRYDHLPLEELTQMVVARCGVHESAAKKMVAVLCDLRALRSSTSVFFARDGLMTLRDLFKWAKRLECSDYADWLQCLADCGYFLLAGRCRNKTDEEFITKALEKHLKRKISPESLFALNSKYMPRNIQSIASTGVAWTLAMRRMIVLCTQAWNCNEPVLMVGETGCGKTTVAQLVAREKLLAMNCHETTETSDFLGSLRPSGDGSFYWMDGIVVQAMREGRPLLIDEISLAADSVLERLNPLLEFSRTLLLTDAGALTEEVHAKEGFKIIATMNPGGDYGKKELSKALRNRFTEIWCSTEFSAEDIETIIIHRLQKSSKVAANVKEVASCMTQFILWYSNRFTHIFRCVISIRDIVAITELFVSCCSITSVGRSIFHAFSATLFDAFGTLQARTVLDSRSLILECCAQLSSILTTFSLADHAFEIEEQEAIDVFMSPEGTLRVGEFLLPRGPLSPNMPKWFTFKAPTCKKNLYRIARSLMINKPVLLEGPPGSGKSSLVTALAAATGHVLTRLNLSDQTELNDLFGMDLPIVNDGVLSFKWKDGPVLKAVKEGHWILLDEMNLASQSVLEGLNACLDHRRQLFIPELNRSFYISDNSIRARFFACQNPSAQGGNRRTLPKSFLNRFTPIYMEGMIAEDEIAVIKQAFNFSNDVVDTMVSVKNAILLERRSNPEFCAIGGPFEFNLRDLLRWGELTSTCHDLAYAFDLLFLARLRTNSDRNQVKKIFVEKFGTEHESSIPNLSISETLVRLGQIELPRNGGYSSNLKLLSSQMSILEKLAVCVKMNWPVLLTGRRGIGKLSAIRNLAALTGNQLEVMRLTSETDAMDLLGSFGQTTDHLDFEAIRSESLIVLSDTQFLKDVMECEDSFALTKILEAASLLSNKDNLDQLHNLILQLNSFHNSLKFHWTNSPFLDAYSKGGWIAIEDVNCCSAAVLDRLNVALEFNGELVLSEKGDSFEAVKANPNFRVFFTMDPTYGSISRAMRNRTVEIYVMPDESAWFIQPQNLLDVVLPHDFHGDWEHGFLLLNILNQLSPSQLLKCRTIFKALNFNHAMEYAKTFLPKECALKIPDEESDNQTVTVLIRYPTVDGNLVGILEQWKWTVMKHLAQHDILKGFLWALLLSSTSSVIEKRIALEFPEIDNSFLNRVGGILELAVGDVKLKNMPFDDRIFGGVALKTSAAVIDYGAVDQIIIASFSYWVLQYVSSLRAEDDSGMQLSQSFKEGNIRSDQLPSSALHHIQDFVVELKLLLHDPFRYVSHSVPEVAEILCSLILFLRCCFTRLNQFTSCAPLHLAWQRMEMNFLKQQHDSVTLCSVVDSISKAWSVGNKQDHRTFLSFYQYSLNILRPFKSKQALEQINSIDETFILQKTPFTELSELSRHSVLGLPMKMIAEILCAFTLLTTEDWEQSLWTVASSLNVWPKGLFIIEACDWSSVQWHKLIRFLWYSTSDFLVPGLHLAFKNCDLARLPLSMELMISLWRSLHYDINLGDVPIDQLENFAFLIDQFSSLFWKLSPHLEEYPEFNRNQILETISLLKDLLQNGSLNDIFTGSVEDENPVALLGRAGYLVMHSFIPAVNMIDPVISDEENYYYLSEKVRLVDSHLSILHRFCRIVNGHASGFTTSSFHPLVNALVSMKNQIQQEMNKYKRESRAYRPSYQKFLQLSFELNSFYKLTSECYVGVLRGCPGVDVYSKDSTDELLVIKVQLENFIVSATSFIERTLLEFTAYPDIIYPYFVGLHCVIIYACDARISIIKLLNERCLESECRLSKSCPVFWDSVRQRLSCPDLYSWAVQEGSSMPKRLQVTVVERLFREGSSTSSAVAWLERNWSQWYENNIERTEKFYIYRKSKLQEEEVDDDAKLMTSIFPDLIEEDKSSAYQVSPEGFLDQVSDDDLENLLMGILNNHSGEINDYMSLLWLADTFRCFGLKGTRINSYFAAFHFAALRKLQKPGLPSSIDVYKTNVPAELIRCAEWLHRLIEKVHQLKDRWPEVTVFDDICQVSEKILKLPASTPQMQLAASVERLLEKVEQWEKIGSREYSLSEDVGQIRKMLVDWRKMEVLSWESLLKRVLDSTRRQTLLISWPLFEAVIKFEKSNKEIVLMLIEWIHCSTLMDFDVRLKIPLLMSRFIEVGGRIQAEKQRAQLLPMLRSIAKHFQQFAGVISDRLATQKASIEKQLKDFLSVVKYNDLNFWSVKLSAEKAHRQLIRIVKQFKLCGEESAASIFDELLPLQTWDFPDAEMPVFGSGNSEGNSLGKRAEVLSEAAVQDLVFVNKFEELNEFLEFAISCNQLIQKDIVYDGEVENMEKQYGRARSKRQKVVALLFKKFAEIGIRSRMGQCVDAEKLTEDALLYIGDSDSDFEKLLRLACANRSVCQKQLHHASKQLSPRIIGCIRGTTEYSLKQLLNFYNLAFATKNDLKLYFKLFVMVKNQYVNAKEGNARFPHHSWSTRITSMARTIESIGFLLQLINKKLDSAPEEDGFAVHEKWKFSHIFESGLSGLCKSHPQFQDLVSNVSDSEASVQRIKAAFSGPLEMIKEFGTVIVWKCSDVRNLRSLLLDEIQKLTINFKKISNLLPNESEDVMTLCKELASSLYVSEEVEDTCVKCSFNEIKDMSLIVIQKIYRKCQEIRNTYSGWKLGVMRDLFDLLQDLRLQTINATLNKLVSQLSIGREVTYPHEQFTLLLSTVHKLSCAVLSTFEMLSTRLATCYLTIQAVSVRLLQKGYVNEIPKLDEHFSEPGKEVDWNNEVSGMGDGAGINDVSGQIEETGQVEGLQTEKSSENEVEETKESENPIDVEDDFLGDVESLELSDGDNENGSDGEDAEPEADHTMGKNEENIEEAVDPDLWRDDQAETDTLKDLDHGNQGAKKETGDLTAKDNSSDLNRETTIEEVSEEVHDDVDFENVDERESMNQAGSDTENKEGSGESNAGTDLEDLSDHNSDDMTNMQNDSAEKYSDMDAASLSDAENTTEMENDIRKETAENEQPGEEHSFEDAVSFSGTGTEKAESEGKDTGFSHEIGNEENGRTNDGRNEKSDPENKGAHVSHSEESEASAPENERLDKPVNNMEDRKDDEKVVADTQEDEVQNVEEDRGPSEPEGEIFVYSSKQTSNVNEKFIVQEGSIDEARSTRTMFENLVDHANLKLDSQEKIGPSKLAKEDLKEQADERNPHELENADNNSFIIHTSGDMYNLMNPERRVVIGNLTKMDETSTAEVTASAELSWSRIVESVSVLSSELAESLRMIIEPTLASRLERTKKAKRNYQILLAVDDSLSMREYNLSVVAWQSVCLIKKALSQLEIGQLAICKFGKTVKVISGFNADEDSSLGGRILTELTFDQDRTDLVNLLICGRKILEETRALGRATQMMIIVSDGRGALANDPKKTSAALRALETEDIVILFVAIDNGEKSIVDMKVAEFSTEGKVTLVPYLERFPFSFYLIVKHISILPAALADAIRQWVELAVQESTLT